MIIFKTGEDLFKIIVDSRLKENYTVTSKLVNK